MTDQTIYYETHGTEQTGSPPLILLHGGVGAHEMFAAQIPMLAHARRVIAADLQGHGCTPDADRPLRFETMADDIAALVARLGVRQVDIIGYSLGGGVALQTAIRHPDIVRKVVLVSTAFRRSAFYPEVLAAMDHMGPNIAAGMQRSPLAKLYPDVNWATLFTKLGDLLRREYDWSAAVRKLRAETMLIFADADSFPLTEIAELYRLLGGGLRDAGLDGSLRPTSRLAIIPGATHYDVLSRPLVGQFAREFLDAP